MSLTASWSVADSDSRPLATNTGWGGFGRWADTLDPKAFVQVVRLWEHGYVRDVALLARQLDAALSHFPPKDSTVHDTAEGLLAIAREAGGADHLAVTNGMGDDDGSEDEWDEEAA